MIHRNSLLLVLLSLCFIYTTSTGQGRNNVWVFGDSVTITFNPFSAGIQFPVNVYQGSSSSISDLSGNLKFYGYSTADSSNYNFYRGFAINRYGSLISNGDSLLVTGPAANIVILDCSYDSTLLFILHCQNYNSSSSGLGGLYFSEVRMNTQLDSGVVVIKNVPLVSLTAMSDLKCVHHGDGKSWWIVFRRFDDSNYPYIPPSNEIGVIKLDSNGFSTPIYQNIGTAVNVISGRSFSNNGTKYVQVSFTGLIEEYDFDRCTGHFSNPITIQTQDTVNLKYFIGAEFSSSGRYLYISTAFPRACLYQYDLQASNIAASKCTLEIDSLNVYGGDLKRGPDGKIYYAKINYNTGNPRFVYNQYNMNLSVINEPDSACPLVNYLPYSLYLGGARSYYALPNNPDYELGPLLGSPCAPVGLEENGLDPPCIQMKRLGDELIFDVSSCRDKELMVELYDVLGRSIYRGSDTRVSLQGLESGILLLRAQAGKAVLREKMMNIK